MNIINRVYIALLAGLVSVGIRSQQVYFVDGYHGGIYGHYPVEWKTRFIVDQLERHPDWRIGLEIEPETWDTVQARTPQDYARFREMATSEQVEFTNPTYAQPYCYNISGESLIRQFQYGIRKIHKHFPEVDFVTYSAEEPCFTSCLPQILKLFGFKYAVLKCPDTCWGGYTNAYGGELVNWVGTDGTSILTVPRYACEQLEENSTWQTTAWANGESYLRACFDAGIEHPVGMCYQDAGWKNGPWLGSGHNTKHNSIYVRWRDYFEHISIGRTNDDWHFSQEDMRVNLMWGSQVLQRIAQEVRRAENKIVTAEKMSVMAHLENGYRHEQADLDDAWRTLMLAQHHDSWIVPYNGLHNYGTWADAIKLWTDHTSEVADGITGEAMRSYGTDGTATDGGYVRVYNTLGTARAEVVSVRLPQAFAASEVEVYDGRNRRVDSSSAEGERLYFKAEVPPFGYATYRVRRKEADGSTFSGSGAEGRKVCGQEYVAENELYRIVFDLSKGGTIKSLIAKKEGNKEFADSTGGYALGELRGFFYEEGKFRSSAETPAELTVLQDNGYETKLQIEGEIASHPFTQVVTLTKGERRIDFDLHIHWKKNVGIGEYKEEHWRDDRRAYCDDRFKLSVLFPVAFREAGIYKDAPFDVCESKQENTFFNRWSDIKHNVILHWVDLAERDGGYGLALLSDHTTSYSYGENYPLGLTAQYSGGGLWGPDYKITQPLRMKYALIPHRGKWDGAAVAESSDRWNEPLQVAYYSSVAQDSKSFIDLHNSGYQISAANLQDGKIMVRLFNAEGDGKSRKITFGLPLSDVEEVDLNGRTLAKKKLKKRGGKSELTLAMPRFGIKTFFLKMEENADGRKE